MTTSLDRALQRLTEKYPPKHPDRSTMRDYEKQRARTNDTPIVTTNGWQNKASSGVVDQRKQDSIPVGSLDRSLWGPPPVRGVAVANKNKKKGKKK